MSAKHFVLFTDDKFYPNPIPIPNPIPNLVNEPCTNWIWDCCLQVCPKWYCTSCSSFFS